MKKIKVGILALTLMSTGLTTLASCGGTTSETQSTVSIRFTNAPTTVERGSDATYRIRTTASEDGIDLSANFSSPEEGDLLTFKGEVNGVTSVSITALSTGTAHITATSAADHNVSVTVEVEIIAPLPSLQRTWKSLIKNRNYTITSTDEEGKVHQIVRATKDALVFTDGDGKPVEEVEGTSEDGSKVNIGLYGLGIDKNHDYAFLLESKNNAFTLPSSAYLVSGNGLLTKDTFLGLGEDANSSNDAGMFYGIQAINPGWLSNKKTEDNKYVIDGTQSDMNSTFVENILWGLADYKGMQDYFEKKEGEDVYLYDSAKQVNTEMEVTGRNEVIATVDNGTKTYTITISNIGTTSIADIKDGNNGDLTAFLSTASVEKPAISPSLEALRKALADEEHQNFVFQQYKGMESVFGTGLTYYYNENFFVGTFDAKFFQALGQSDAQQSFAIVKQKNGFFYYPYTPSVKDDASTTDKDETAAFVFDTTKGQKAANLTGQDDKGNTVDITIGDVIQALGWKWFPATAAATVDFYYPLHVTDKLIYNQTSSFYNSVSDVFGLIGGYPSDLNVYINTFTVNTDRVQVAGADTKDDTTDDKFEDVVLSADIETFSASQLAEDGQNYYGVPFNYGFSNFGKTGDKSVLEIADILADLETKDGVESTTTAA